MDIDMTTGVGDRAPEHKSGVAGDALVTHDELMRVFDEFKGDNDRRIHDIEKRGSSAWPSLARDGEAATCRTLITAEVRGELRPRSTNWPGRPVAPVSQRRA